MDTQELSYAKALKRLDYSLKLVNLLRDHIKSPKSLLYKKISETLLALPEVKIVNFGTKNINFLIAGDFTYKDQSFTIFTIRRDHIQLYFSPFLLYIDNAISKSERFLLEVFRSSNRKKEILNNTLNNLHSAYSGIIKIIQESSLLEPVCIIKKQSIKIKNNSYLTKDNNNTISYFLHLLKDLSLFLENIRKIHREFYINMLLS